VKFRSAASQLVRLHITRRAFLQSALATGAALALPASIWAREPSPTLARGTVFHARHGKGRRHSDDPGLRGVAVSNGREISLTDERGRWALPVEGESTTFFVIKPRGWITPLNAHNLPRFHYHHQPAGSPQQRFAGIQPTGPLPESIDFALIPRAEPDRFKALFCGDPQPRDAREVDYLAQTVVPELAGTDAMFGVSLGDIAFDNLDMYEPLNEAFGLIGIPWHNVLGNHDLNFDTPDNRHAHETFRRVFGPTYYSFDAGPVHFLLLNNIEWLGADPKRPQATGNYQGKLGERQLEFVARDLERVPANQLVVILLHIPLQRGFDPGPRSQTLDRQALYRLLENRPHTLSFSAHTHWHRHLFIGAEDGWRGGQPHHHIITGTLCGSWFGGAPDERGIPHATMSDGTPRGYIELEFDGPSYSMNGYRSMGRPASYQMHIDTPPELNLQHLPEAAVTVNVFNGSERSTVRMRCGAGDCWRDLDKIEAPDPRFLRLRERDQALQPPYRALPQPMLNCPHLWRGPLPPSLAPGTHLIEVIATDMFGNTHYGQQPVRIAG
jgi:hypothetical protein